MNILFEDADIVVCVKPHGVISQSAPDGKDMIGLLEARMGCKVYPVHRLDRETGGVMVYAKTPAAAAKLCRDVAAHKLHKEYLAVVHKDFPFEQGELHDLLFRDQKRNKSYVVDRQRKGVKEAILQYEKIKTAVSPFGEITLLKIVLITGRTHQIRAQFAGRGYPLLGDRRYGAKDTAENMGLWSHTLIFDHPTNGKQLSFTFEPQNSAAFEMCGMG